MERSWGLVELSFENSTRIGPREAVYMDFDALRRGSTKLTDRHYITIDGTEKSECNNSLETDVFYYCSTENEQYSWIYAVSIGSKKNCSG